MIVRDGDVTPLAGVEPRLDDTRLNDCRCDPQGRLWAGTMSTTRRPLRGALHRVDADGRVTVAVPETTLSNGLG